MILCHKCAGLLAYNDNENIQGLRSCECISGYVRGFEPFLNREEAIWKQACTQEMRANLYRTQQRQPQQIEARLAERDRLLDLL